MRGNDGTLESILARFTPAQAKLHMGRCAVL